MGQGPRLSTFPADREVLKQKIAEQYPNKKPGAIPVDAGQLFRFVNEMKIGDLVIYPSKVDKQVHLGLVTSEYFHDATPEPGYPHRRKVSWKQELPRTRFSQGALYEIGSAMSFFQVKNYADGFRAALEGTDVAAPADDDETIGIVAAEIEQTTRDFVKKRIAERLKGHPFAHLVAALLETMGYRTRVSPEGPDRGIDIIAHRDELGFEPPIIKVQVKSGEGSTGDPVVSALFGKVADGEFGLLITLGTLTPPARAFAETKSNLRLVDGDEFVDMLLEHYGELDTQYKGLLPLKHVFIPESVGDPDR